MVGTLQEYVSNSGGGSDGATNTQIVLALLYLLKCAMVLVFFVASTTVTRGATFRRMFCPHQTTRRRRTASRGGECSSKQKHGPAFVPGRAGAPVPQTAVDSFQYNLAATGYLYLVLALWDTELALSSHHFLDTNYGPIFLVYLLSVAKALLSIHVNVGALSAGTASASTTKSLWLNVVRLLCVAAGFACHFGKRFFVVAARQRESSSGDGGGGGDSSSGGGRGSCDAVSDDDGTASACSAGKHDLQRSSEMEV
jgi:hypothetical protein